MIGNERVNTISIFNSCHMENECTACPSNAWADKVSCYISEKLDRFTKPNYFLPVSNFLFFTIPILDPLFVLPNSFSSWIERSLWPKLRNLASFFGNITTSVFRFRSFRCFGFSDGAHQTVREKKIILVFGKKKLFGAIVGGFISSLRQPAWCWSSG